MPPAQPRTLADHVSVRLETITDLSSRLQRQRDRWYRCWKWTFGALLVSVIGHLAWWLGRLL